MFRAERGPVLEVVKMIPTHTKTSRDSWTRAADRIAQRSLVIVELVASDWQLTI